MSGYSGGGFGDGAGKALVLFALVPFLLVNIVLSAVFGDWVWKVTPILFVAMVTGMRVYRAYRRQVDTSEPLDLGQHGRFSGEEKARTLRGGAWLVFAVSLAIILATIFLPLILFG
ncbi:hypothetical protein K3175_02155 [Qipengyuania sp. GH1]|uniref:hypothetical protein n=1 Tax=Qipengyuania aestuarii TaxID=2867241 RepID=UPI001C871B84|nr:hypothetical protein [Qipengyuania aestuarii]MBX7534457.1 hypothetical protein [Qipengyuania aestuarii]